MKIGLVGGSFDPPHFGHIGISKDAIKLLKLDKIWWLPTKQNPLKTNQSSNFDERLSLCKEISKDEPKIIIKDTERHLKSSYLIDLLNKIIAQNPEDEFFLIIGDDNLTNFHLWHKWQLIIKLIKIIIFNRNMHHEEIANSKLVDFCKKNNQKDRLIFVKNKKYDISSTKLRNSNE